MPNFVFLGSINLMLAVILGAFGAHGLKSRVTDEQLAWWHTGVQYHAWHALGLLCIGLLLQLQPALAQARTAGLLLQAGIVVFAGTLYAMTLGAPRWFGAITPLGGTLLIAGWAVLAWTAWKAGL
ncbi:MAG TPA: DUF423 domain-containing protein [Moraxellaceae bacterium]|nr:DUF423 domain-containing protein [Moraxellaceae bacterium]